MVFEVEASTRPRVALVLEFIDSADDGRELGCDDELETDFMFRYFRIVGVKGAVKLNGCEIVFACIDV